MAAGVRRLDDFGTMPDGQVVQRWELDNGNGLRAEVLNLGGIVLRLDVPDRTGRAANVLLSPADVGTVLGSSWPYFGAIIGRVGNRIAKGQFSLDGTTHQLAKNNGGIHHLHGGDVGYDRRIWSIAPVPVDDGVAVRLELVDAAGTEHYPGTAKVSVVYTLTTGGAWRIDYEATTDHATPINLTNHAYFNLKDAGRSKVTEHELRLFASAYTPSDATLIPAGLIAPVAGTPFDFTVAKPIGRDLSKLGNVPVGYDFNFVIDGPAGVLRRAAEVFESASGRVMNIWTTEPGVQFYTGNFLDGSLVGIDGIAYGQHSGFCLETQHYPDSPNQPTFPSIILRPGEVFRTTTEHRFSTR